MKLEALHRYLLLAGLVSDGSDATLPKLYLHSAQAAEHANHDMYALLMIGGAGFEIDEELPSYHKGRLQLIISARNYDSGYDLAVTLMKALTVYGLNLSDMYVYRCVPRHLPMSYPVNEQGAFEFSVNFDATIRTT
jgi:hypothetical protein